MKGLYLIMVIGHNSSGKTVVSKKIADIFKLSMVNNDLIRSFISKNIRYYKDLIFSYPYT